MNAKSPSSATFPICATGMVVVVEGGDVVLLDVDELDVERDDVLELDAVGALLHAATKKPIVSKRTTLPTTDRRRFALKPTPSQHGLPTRRIISAPCRDA